MKLLLLVTLLVGLLSSCSSSRTFNNGPFQKRKYNSGFYFNSKKNIQANKEKVTSEEMFNEVKQTINEVKFVPSTVKHLPTAALSEKVTDSVKIILKNGETYVGTLIEDTDSGVVIELKNGRTIYFRKDDIEETTVLKATEKTDSTDPPDDYALPTNLNTQTTSTIELNAWEQKKLPTQSKLAVIFGLTALLLGIISFSTIGSPSLLVISALATLGSFCLYISGLVVAIVGSVIAKKRSFRYDDRRAKNLMLIFLIPAIVATIGIIYLIATI